MQSVPTVLSFAIMVWLCAAQHVLVAQRQDKKEHPEAPPHMNSNTSVAGAMNASCPGAKRGCRQTMNQREGDEWKHSPCLVWCSSCAHLCSPRSCIGCTEINSHRQQSVLTTDCVAGNAQVIFHKLSAPKNSEMWFWFCCLNLPVIVGSQ